MMSVGKISSADGENPGKVDRNSKSPENMSIDGSVLKSDEAELMKGLGGGGSKCPKDINPLDIGNGLKSP
jgi:hypothetical protein